MTKSLVKDDSLKYTGKFAVLSTQISREENMQLYYLLGRISFYLRAYLIYCKCLSQNVISCLPVVFYNEFVLKH